ncbi:MAG TPA: aminotransferase class I/II-fold pyridoxal phosphate-dependent enzyme, partial [bacterium]|nr:aminotransferase class I/II-fold pyridoxal phosphate-dependent enzyme [bacterium]
FAHVSLWDGVTSAGATPRPFKHNDPDSLEHMATRFGPGIVLVDAVYSTSGTIARLAELLAVAEKHGCVMVVDESHSLGVFGEHGEGLTAALGLADRVHFRTASLSKAFAGRGGIVAGAARDMEYFRYESRPAIFSSSVLDFEAAGFQATLEIVAAENERRMKLHANADYLRERLSALDYNVDASQCQIVSLVAGTEQQTLVLRDALESRGVFGSVFCAPATAKNRALIRFTVTCALGKEELDRVVAVCASIRDEVGMYEWASTRKRGVRELAAKVDAA